MVLFFVNVDESEYVIKVNIILNPLYTVQGSYASGKCQGNFKFFKVRELSGNFIICQGKLNFC